MSSGGCALTRRVLPQVPHYDRDGRAGKDVTLNGRTRHFPLGRWPGGRSTGQEALAPTLEYASP